MVTAASNGPARITACVATVVASDTGGYVAGVLFGNSVSAFYGPPRTVTLSVQAKF